MQLPSLISISPDDGATLKRLADMMGESFMEEMWFKTWLEGLDALGVSEARKLEIMRAYFLDDLTAMAKRRGVYALEDLTAATGGYLASEYEAMLPCGAARDQDSAYDCENGMHGANAREGKPCDRSIRQERARDTGTQDDGAQLGHVAQLLTPEEVAALSAREQDMSAISDFDWHRTWSREADDYIYFASWAVDRNARGTHALSRLLAPILAFADANGLDCYLECYADCLQSMYEHYGFRVVRELHDERFPIYERCMIRSAQR